jgi:capsular polysaccharide transport system permease protein
MIVETKDKTPNRLIVGRRSAALPAIRHALRILRLELVPKGSGAAPQKIEPSRDNAFDRTQTATEGPPWLISFAIVVIVPVVVASLYFAFLASDQFVSELRFAVRGSTERLPGADALGVTGGLAYLNSSQEVYAIADYIRSRAAVEEVGRTIDLRRLFRAGGADWFSRLKHETSGEELLRYWRKMITVSTEAVSGLVSIEVRAFTREDAVAVASAIRGASETLVNRMQQRPREDMVVRAESEVRVARERAAQARDAVARYRASQSIVDPLDTARSLIDNVTELKANLIALDVELASAKAATGANAPSVQPLQARRDSLNEQVQKLQRRITSSNAGERTSARLMADYDKVEIGSTLAEQQVAVAEKTLDQLRIEAHHRQIYIDVIEGPTTPQSALFPERTLSVAKIAIGALGLWGVAFMAFAGVRDHAD